MLDRTVVFPERSHTEYVTRAVHEHRAPTDDSVKLLREMEKKARDQVIEAIHVGDTTFECVVHQQHDFASDLTTWRAVFSLNGKNLTADFEFRPWQTKPADAAVGLRDAISKKIATEILSPSLSRFAERMPKQ